MSTGAQRRAALHALQTPARSARVKLGQRTYFTLMFKVPPKPERDHRNPKILGSAKVDIHQFAEFFERRSNTHAFVRRNRNVDIGRADGYVRYTVGTARCGPIPTQQRRRLS